MLVEEILASYMNLNFLGSNIEVEVDDQILVSYTGSNIGGEIMIIKYWHQTLLIFFDQFLIKYWRLDDDDQILLSIISCRGLQYLQMSNCYENVRTDVMMTPRRLVCVFWSVKRSEHTKNMPSQYLTYQYLHCITTLLSTGTY